MISTARILILSLGVAGLSTTRVTPEAPVTALSLAIGRQGAERRVAADRRGGQQSNPVRARQPRCGTAAV